MKQIFAGRLNVFVGLSSGLRANVGLAARKNNQGVPGHLMEEGDSKVAEVKKEWYFVKVIGFGC